MFIRVRAISTITINIGTIRIAITVTITRITQFIFQLLFLCWS